MLVNKKSVFFFLLTVAHLYHMLVPPVEHHADVSAITVGEEEERRGKKSLITSFFLVCVCDHRSSSLFSPAVSHFGWGGGGMELLRYWKGLPLPPSTSNLGHAQNIIFLTTEKGTRI